MLQRSIVILVGETPGAIFVHTHLQPMSLTYCLLLSITFKGGLAVSIDGSLFDESVVS